MTTVMASITEGDHEQPALTRGVLGRLLAPFRPWNEGRWPLRPWRGMPRRYQLAIGVWLVVDAAVVAALVTFAPSTISMVEGQMLVVSIVLTSYLCAVRTRETSVINEEPQLWIAAILALAGHPIEAAACATLGTLIRLHRKRLVPHLGLLNIANGVTLVAMIVLLQTTLAGSTDSVSARWMAPALFTAFAAPALQSFLVHTVISLGGYCTMRDSVRSWTYGARTQGAASAPLAVMAATLMHELGAWSALMLLVPSIVSAALSVRSEHAVQAQEESVRDHLTGLPNRRAFEQELHTLLESKPEDAWLLVCDLDSFKQLNDTLGHDAGDHALVETARVFGGIVDHARCFRYGGDEFVLVESGDESHIAAVSERICSDLETTLGFLGVGISIGAHRIRPTDDAMSARNMADMAMYLSKRTGGNGCHFSTELEGYREQDASDLDVSRIDARQSPTASGEALTYWERSADRARAAGNTHELAKAMYQLYWHDDQENASVRLQAAADLGPDTFGWAARAAAALCNRSDDFGAAITHDARAMQVARLRGDRILEVTSMLGQAHSRFMLGDMEAAIAIAREARHLARLHASDDWVVQAHMMVIRFLQHDLQLPEARNEVEQLCTFAESRDDETHLVEARLLGVEVLLACGDTASAATALEAFEPATLSEHAAHAYPLMAHALAATGGATELARLRASLDELGDTDDPNHYVLRELAHGHLLLAEEQVEEAFMRVTNALEAAEDANVDVRAQALRFVVRGASRTGRWTAFDDLHDVSDIASSSAVSPAAQLALREVNATIEAWASGTMEQLYAVGDSYRELNLLDELWYVSVTAALIEQFHGHDRAIDHLFALASDAPAGIAPGERAFLDSVVEAAGHTAQGLTVATLQRAFPGMSLEQYSTMAAQSSRREFPPGSPVAWDTGDVPYIYVVAQGEAMLARATTPGSRGYLIEFLLEGDSWGIREPGTEPGNFEVTTLGECSIVAVAESVVRELAGETTTLRETVRSLAHARNRAARSASEQMGWSVSRRLAKLVLDLDRQFGHPTLDGHRIVNRVFTQAELATMLGASRKSVSEHLGALRHAGVVSERGRRLLIKDAPALVQAAMAVSSPGDDEQHRAA